MKDFGDDVLPAYEAAATQRGFWQQEIDRLHAQLNEVHELVQQHDQAVARLPNLAKIYLEQCQQVLAEHLRQADLQLLEEWRANTVPGDRAIQMSLRTVAGLRAKYEILREVHDRAFSDAVNKLMERAHKYERKREKFLRPKNRHREFSPNEMDTSFDETLRKLEARQQQLSQLVHRIDGYDDYQRFDLKNEQELWWSEFTGGKRPPTQLARLRNYYDRRPDLVVVRDEPDVPRAIERAAGTIPRSDEQDYLS
jgi:hypothetical protein